MANDLVHSPLAWDQLLYCKRAFTTRRANLAEAVSLVTSGCAPRAGDLVLARVDRLGQHARIELPTGRRSQLHEGDLILVAYGARYAPDQFEAIVPPDLGPCELVAGGGVAAKVLSRSRQVGEATKITPLGMIADRHGEVLNVARWSLRNPGLDTPPAVIAVVGTSMNAGKTTAASKLIHGLVRSGRKVGAAKVTGTGSGGDLWSMSDAGACTAVDFTDFGHVSTYLLDEDEAVRTARGLIGHLASLNVDVAVIEVADGLMQRETGMLLGSPAFTGLLDAVLFSAFDAAGAVFGVERLRGLGLPVVALSGLLSTSPLGAREAAEATGLPVASSAQLTDPTYLAQMIGHVFVDEERQALSA
jgi:hypothetical protein